MPIALAESAFGARQITLQNSAISFLCVFVFVYFVLFSKKKYEKMLENQTKQRVFWFCFARSFAAAVWCVVHKHTHTHTGNTTSGNVCLESGALAVLQKPLKAHEVQDLILSEEIMRPHHATMA